MKVKNNVKCEIVIKIKKKRLNMGLEIDLKKHDK